MIAVLAPAYNSPHALVARHQAGRLLLVLPQQWRPACIVEVSPAEAPETVSHDPDDLLRDYAQLQAEAHGLRSQLKAILAESLSGPQA